MSESTPLHHSSLESSNSGHSSISGSGWYLQGFWRAPELVRGTDANDLDYEKERDLEWTELFFDLIFVTAITRIGEKFAEGELAVTNYVLYFLTIFELWHHHVSYSSRFAVDDMFNKLFSAVYMFGMIVMTAHITTDFQSDAFRWFSAAAATNYLLLVLAHVRVVYHIKDTQKYALQLIIRQITAAVLFSSIAMSYRPFTSWEVFALWLNIAFTYAHPPLVVFVLRYIQWPSWIHGNVYLPYHLEHYTDRVGGFVIIVLGFSIDNIAQKTSEYGWEYLALLGLAFLIVFNMKLLHFDANAVDLECHAIRVNVYSACTWILLLPLMTCAIALVGTSLKMIIDSFNSDEITSSAGTRTLAFSVGTALFLSSLLSLCHTHKFDLLESVGTTGEKCVILRIIFQVQLGIQILVSITCFGLSYFTFLPALEFLGIFATLTLIMVVVNLSDKYLEYRCERFILRPTAFTVSKDEPVASPLSPVSEMRKYDQLKQLLDYISDDQAELREQIREASANLYRHHKPCHYFSANSLESSPTYGSASGN